MQIAFKSLIGMNYGFINVEKPVVEQKKIIHKIAFQKKVKIDVWLECSLRLLESFSKTQIKKTDTVFISNLEFFKSTSMLESMNVLRSFNQKEISVYSQENLDKSPMYLICLLNKIAS